MDKYHSKQDDASIFDFEDLIPKKRCRKITVIESDDDDDSVHLKSSTNQNGQNLTSVSTGKITQETLFLRGEGIKEKELLYVDLPYKQDDNSDSEDFRSVKKGRMAMVIRDDDDDMIEVKDSKNQESDTTSIHSEENLCVQDKCKKIVEKLDYNSDLDFAPKKKRKIVIAPSSENTSSESSEEEKIKRNSIKKSNFSRENSIIRGEMDSCEDSKGSSDKEDEDSDSSFIDDSTDESCDVSKMLKEAIYHVGRSGYDLEPVSYSSPRKTRKDEDEDKNVSQLEKECNSRRYPHKLLATLKELSSNDVKTPHEILKEWEFYKTEIDEEMLSECSCGKKNIKELNFMKNKKTSSVCIIGSECIHWFDELNLNGIMKLGQMLLRKGVLVNFRHHQKDKLLFRVDFKELSLQHTFHLLRKPMLREYYSVPFHYNKCAESWFFNVYSDNMTKLKINKEYHIFIKMVAEVLGRKEVHINEKDSSSESDEEATVKEIDNWEEKSISKKDEKIVFYLRKVELPKAKEPVVSKPSIKQFFKI